MAFPSGSDAREGKWYRVVKCSPLVIPQPEEGATRTKLEVEKQQVADAGRLGWR